MLESRERKKGTVIFHLSDFQRGEQMMVNWYLCEGCQQGVSIKRQVIWQQVPGGLQSIELQRVRQDWSDLAGTHSCTHHGKQFDTIPQHQLFSQKALYEFQLYHLLALWSWLLNLGFHTCEMEIIIEFIKWNCYKGSIIEFVYVKGLEKYLAYSKPYFYAFKLWC